MFDFWFASEMSCISIPWTNLCLTLDLNSPGIVDSKGKTHTDTNQPLTTIKKRRRNKRDRGREQYTNKMVIKGRVMIVAA